MDDPKVSAIIIFLNEERYLHEAIESVLAQSYSSWELLLIDDGSTDGSTEIARLYAQQHPKKIRYLEHIGHKNRGKSASRNLGVMHSNGEYIALLDADDVWLPHKLERQIAILEKYPEADLVYGPWQAWYSWNENEKRKDHLVNMNVAPDRLFSPPELVNIWLRHETRIPGHCTTMVRRSIYQELGGYEESFRDIFEDLAFLVKVGLKSTIYVSSECLSRYRQHCDSTCQVYGKEGRLEQAQLAYFEWLEVNLEPVKLQYREVWSSLQFALLIRRRPLIRKTFHLLENTKYIPYHITRRIIPNLEKLFIYWKI